jgi:hypothetical protein
MKTHLFATVALAIGATAAPAEAAKLPKNFLGSWCLVDTIFEGTKVYKRGRCSEKVRGSVGDMHDITIRANGYDVYESDCRTIKTKGPFKDKYMTTYRCESDEWEGGGNLEVMIWREGENLFVYAFESKETPK